MKILIIIVLMFSFCFVLNAKDKEDIDKKIAVAEIQNICDEPGKCPCPEPDKGDRRPGKAVFTESYEDKSTVVPEAVEEK